MAASARAVNQRESLVVLRVVIGVRIILPVAGKFNSASATELMSLLMSPTRQKISEGTIRSSAPVMHR
jgi:hypothetical protein